MMIIFQHFYDLYAGRAVAECNYSARTDTEHNKRIVKGHQAPIYYSNCASCRGPTVSV